MVGVNHINLCVMLCVVTYMCFPSLAKCYDMFREIYLCFVFIRCV
jgi:hypothetical protein